MRFSKVSFVVALAALTVAGLAVEEGALKFAPKVGDVHKYKQSADVTLAGMAVKMSASVTEKVAKVDPANGNITTVSTSSNVQIEVGGNPVTVPNNDQSVTNVQRPDGTIVEIKSETVGPNEYRVATIMTIKLPDFALAKDKTWTWDCPADTKLGIVHTKGEYKVLGDEKLHDIDTWKLSAKVAEVDGDTPGSVESTVWISKADGTMVKVDSKGANVPFPGAPAPISGTFGEELAP